MEGLFLIVNIVNTINVTHREECGHTPPSSRTDAESLERLTPGLRSS